MKSLLHLIIYALVAVIFSACGEKPRKFVIGVSQCSEDIWRDKLNDELKTGEYLNDSIIVKLASSNDDNEKQVRQINQFIDEKVDLLIVSPNQLNTISRAIDRAYDKGIPVILYDRKTDSDKYTAFIGCDNYVIGLTMGRFIAQQLGGRGRVAEIRGLEGSSPAMERHRGFMDALKEYPDIELAASEAGDWKEESAIAAMKRILGQTRDFDYVFSHNDRMAWGAYVAAKQMGETRPYKYTGVDAMATEGGGLELVRDGVFDATYLYPTKGDEVIALALRILNHKPYERDNYLRTSIITHANAELTLMEAKDAESQKRNLSMLHKQVDQYVADYHAQSLLVVGLGVLLLVIFVATALLYRGYLVQTRLNEEIMELTHSRLQFFTNISHELRTPLTLIADPVEMLLEDKGISGKSRELLKMVQRNALSLQQLVGSILDFRKIQNGKMELKLSRFDIVEALGIWVGDFRLTAERKQIELRLDTSAYSTSKEIVADKEKVARIVFNLLSNAMKYTPEGGRIDVALSNTQDGRMRIDVKDTGKGIAKEETEKVFERFFQSKGSASGTGIGLALVKSFAELHHGTARVESELGKGSAFIIEMPTEQQGNVMETTPEVKEWIDDASQYISGENKQQGKVDQLISDEEKPTLLIIDDNNDIRQYERTLLQNQYFVIEASDGKEGLEKAVNEVPDLVVCDIMMPIMDGLQFCHELKTNTATCHIPVIMLTAKNLEEQRVEGYENGADSYITKPFHGKVLKARIENLLKQRQRLSEALRKDGACETLDTSEESIQQLADPDKRFVKQLHDIIRDHIGESDFGVEEVAAEIGLSRVQLYRKVKAMTGSTVVDLMRKARLARARHMLTTTHASISEVAYAVGFSSPGYFSRCFKEEFGEQPGEVALGK